MLLVPTEIRSSSIHGIGLFAKEFIPKGVVIWRFDSRIDRVYGDEELKEMPQELREFIEIYSCWHSSTGLWTMCCDNSRFMNHAENPNLVSTEGFDPVPSARDIQAGEELTINYKGICDDFRDKGLSYGEETK